MHGLRTPLWQMGKKIGKTHGKNHLQKNAACKRQARRVILYGPLAAAASGPPPVDDNWKAAELRGKLAGAPPRRAPADSHFQERKPHGPNDESRRLRRTRTHRGGG
jgi:hypothetical protein